MSYTEYSGPRNPKSFFEVHMLFYSAIIGNASLNLRFSTHNGLLLLHPAETYPQNMRKMRLAYWEYRCCCYDTCSQLCDSNVSINLHKFLYTCECIWQLVWKLWWNWRTFFSGQYICFKFLKKKYWAEIQYFRILF